MLGLESKSRCNLRLRWCCLEQGFRATQRRAALLMTWVPFARQVSGPEHPHVTPRAHTSAFVDRRMPTAGELVLFVAKSNLPISGARYIGVPLMWRPQMPSVVTFFAIPKLKSENITLFLWNFEGCERKKVFTSQLFSFSFDSQLHFKLKVIQSGTFVIDSK